MPRPRRDRRSDPRDLAPDLADDPRGRSVRLQSALAPTATNDHPAPGQPSRAQVDLARQSLAKHWEALFSAKFDDAYAASLREVATIHAQVGLDPCWLIGGYLTTLTELHSLVLAAHGTSMMTWSARSRLERAIRAVDQAVLFDLQLRVAAYTEQVAKMEHEKMVRVVRQLQHPAPALIETLMPPNPASRRTANELFVASQRRTFQGVVAEEQDGTEASAAHAAPFVSVAATTAASAQPVMA